MKNMLNQLKKSPDGVALPENQSGELQGKAI